MYPLKFDNLYYDKIWGGRDLELFRSNLPEGNIGESWDVACHPHGINVVKNGKFKGVKLDELIKLKGSDLLGTKIRQEWFPLLVKLINEKDKLSVQVHPNDKYAKEVEGEMGETEVWYIVEAFEGANLIAEIQQNSDTTYRVYDYNRGREIHVEKALYVIDLDIVGSKSTGIEEEYEGYTKTQFCPCNEFVLDLYDIKKSFKECSSIERFYIFTCVDGQGQICCNEEEIEILKGDSILIPATTGEYEFKGEMKILKSYVS